MSRGKQHLSIKTIEVNELRPSIAGGVLAPGLLRSSLDQAVWVPALAGNVVLCSILKR